MNTPIAYVGATFSLLMGLGSAATCAWSMVSGFPVLMDVASGGIALIMGFIFVKNDWPRIWKPLLTGS
jgi:hypothetical protein